MRSEDDSDLIAPRYHKNTDIYKSSTKIFPETFFCFIIHQVLFIFFYFSTVIPAAAQLFYSMC